MDAVPNDSYCLQSFLGMPLDKAGASSGARCGLFRWFRQSEIFIQCLLLHYLQISFLVSSGGCFTVQYYIHIEKLMAFIINKLVKRIGNRMREDL